MLEQEQKQQNIRANRLMIMATTQVMDTLRSYPNPNGIEIFSVANRKLLEAIKPEFVEKFGLEEWERQYKLSDRNTTQMKLDKLKEEEEKLKKHNEEIASKQKSLDEAKEMMRQAEIAELRRLQTFWKTKLNDPSFKGEADPKQKLEEIEKELLKLGEIP